VSLNAESIAFNNRREFYGTSHPQSDETPEWVRRSFGLDAMRWRIGGAGFALFGLIGTLLILLAMIPTPTR
jgi:hypothetical protein